MIENLLKRSLFLPLLLGLFQVIYHHSLTPSIHFFPLLPVVAIAALRYSLASSLFIAFFIGLISDLLAETLHFGVHATACVFAQAFLWAYRRNFFEEKLFSIPLFTIVLSLCTSLFLLPFLLSLPSTPPFSFQSFLSYIFAVFNDGALSLLWFTLPLRATNLFYKQLFRWRHA